MRLASLFVLRLAKLLAFVIRKMSMLSLQTPKNRSPLCVPLVQQEMLCLRCIYFQGRDLSITPCLIVWMELTLGIHQQGGYRPSSSLGGLPITLLNVSLFVLSFYSLMVIHHKSTFTHLNFAGITISFCTVSLRIRLI